MRLKIKLVYSFFVVLLVGAVSASPWPVGMNDETTAVYGQPTTIPVIENDTGDNLFISSVNTTSKNLGKVSINEDKKSVTFTSSNAREDEFWYVLEDNQGRTNAAKVTVSISDNIWPAANADTAVATYNEVVTIPVLDNDTGSELTLSSVNEWSSDQGKVWIEDNQVKYKQVGEPRGDIFDEFWYVFEDKWGRKNAAKVVVSVTAQPTTAWPTAVADFAEAKGGLKVRIPVLENDTGEGLSLVKSNEWTQNGGRTVMRGSVIRYTPPANFTGTDAFWYDFEDKYGRANSAKVEVEVTQNTQLSVVNFCGTTYQTDGTIEGTVPTELTAQAPQPTHHIDGGASWRIGGEGVLDGRKYSLEVAESGEQSIWVEVNSQRSLVVEVAASENLTLLGAYNKTVYFNRGLNLYAHDGKKTVALGDLSAGTFDTSNKLQRGEVVAGDDHNALYFTVNVYDDTNPNETIGHRHYWRVSDGLDLHPVNIDYLKTVNDGDYTTPFQTIRYLDRDYYNGYDYSFQRLLDYPEDYEGPLNRIVRQDHGAIIDAFSATGSTVTDNIHESNGRLFLVTSTYPTQTGYLYMIDNKDDSFVTLKACTS